jgi:hypothetical protein
MMLKRLLRFILPLLALTAWPVRPASAQAPGYAEITSPRPGETISGLVTVSGSAAHPSFASFDLSFSYDPNPTNTWFPIGDPQLTEVRDGRLGLWDTTGISDGLYDLRLRVHLTNGNELETIVRGLRIGGQPTPGEIDVTPNPASPVARGNQTTVTPSATMSPLIATPGPSSQNPVFETIKIGAGSAAGGLAIVSLYLAIKGELRRHRATGRLGRRSRRRSGRNQ